MNRQKLGVEMTEITPKRVVLSRTTLESQIDITIEDAKKRDYKISTGIKFFNHMLTGVASRACLNFDINYQPTKAETLDHVIAEDVGLTLGRGIRELIDVRQNEGVNGRGMYTVAFDEALVNAVVSFDGRSYSFISGDVPALKLEYAEDILSTNLKQFFEGFAQGSGCTIFLQFIAGIDSHHAWEAAFKAFGEALRDALLPCLYRAGSTIGLKGTGMEKKYE